MKNNYKKMSKKELLTSVYADSTFRKAYFKWTRIGGYKNNKKMVNDTVVNYEWWLYDKLNSTWFGRLRYNDIDLVNYSGHRKQIKEYLSLEMSA